MLRRGDRAPAIWTSADPQDLREAASHAADREGVDAHGPALPGLESLELERGRKSLELEGGRMGLGDERKWELPPRLQAGAQSAGDSLGARAEGPRLNDRRTPRRRSANQARKARPVDLAPPLLSPCSRLEELTTGLLPVARRVIALLTLGRTRGCEPRGRSRGATWLPRRPSEALRSWPSLSRNSSWRSTASSTPCPSS